jgi:hypothetical protein
MRLPLAISISLGVLALAASAGAGPRYPEPMRGGPPPWRPPEITAPRRPEGDQERVRAGVRQQRFVALEQVLPNLRARTPGRLLDSQMTDFRGRPAYMVVWLTRDGRRIDYFVDAQSGQILGER